MIEILKSCYYGSMTEKNASRSDEFSQLNGLPVDGRDIHQVLGGCVSELYPMIGQGPDGKMATLARRAVGWAETTYVDRIREVVPLVIGEDREYRNLGSMGTRPETKLMKESLLYLVRMANRLGVVEYLKGSQEEARRLMSLAWEWSREFNLARGEYDGETQRYQLEWRSCKRLAEIDAVSAVTAMANEYGRFSGSMEEILPRLREQEQGEELIGREAKAQDNSGAMALTIAELMISNRELFEAQLPGDDPISKVNFEENVDVWLRRAVDHFVKTIAVLHNAGGGLYRFADSKVAVFSNYLFANWTQIKWLVDTSRVRQTVTIRPEGEEKVGVPSGMEQVLMSLVASENAARLLRVVAKGDSSSDVLAYKDEVMRRSAEVLILLSELEILARLYARKNGEADGVGSEADLVTLVSSDQYLMLRRRLRRELLGNPWMGEVIDMSKMRTREIEIGGAPGESEMLFWAEAIINRLETNEDIDPVDADENKATWRRLLKVREKAASLG